MPSHLRVVNHLSHERSEQEATTFLAALKARTDGRPPLFTSDKWPAYIEALRGYPETLSLHRRKLMQHPCGNEIQGDRKEQVGSA